MSDTEVENGLRNLTHAGMMGRFFFWVGFGALGAIHVYCYQKRISSYVRDMPVFVEIDPVEFEEIVSGLCRIGGVKKMLGNPSETFGETTAVYFPATPNANQLFSLLTGISSALGNQTALVNPIIPLYLANGREWERTAIKHGGYR